MDNKCPSCSAKIDFNFVTQTWDCSSCGAKFTLDQMNNFANGNSATMNPASGTQVSGTVASTPPVANPVPPTPNVAVSPVNNNVVYEKETEINGLDVYHCKNCGAEFMTDEKSIMTTCVYCGSNAILKGMIHGEKAPNFILPFKKSKGDAARAFRNLMKNKPLMPRVFRKIKNPDQITGVYIPYWAYDITCDGNITFECKDMNRSMDENFRYIKTSQFETTLNAHLDYSKVLADGSTHFNSEMLNSIEPFQLGELTNYNHAYLCGVYAEKSNIPEDQAYLSANERVMNTSIDLAKKETKHQASVVKQNHFYLAKRKADCILLPVWMVHINYQNKDYSFLMNGQTGKTVGNIPIGKMETVLWTIAVFFIFVAIGYLFSMLGR